MRRLAPLLLPLTLSGRVDFEHGLTLAPLAPPQAHHGEKMGLSRFLVAVPGIEETAPRLIGRCVDGEQVASKLPLALGVIEVRLESLAFAGDPVGTSVAGVPGPDALEGLHRKLDQAAESTRWLSRRGCRPWDGELPWLLLAADERVPAQAIQVVMEAAHSAGFRDLAMLVDDGSPGPELPPEELPRNPVELVLVEQAAGWTVVGPDDARRSGSLDDVQVWLRTGELSADRVTVVMLPDSELQDLVHAHDALIGAGVLSVHPGQPEGAGVAAPGKPRELGRSEINWVIDAQGVVPVHLVRLPERGVRVPPMRLGPELRYRDMELVGPLTSLPVEAQLKTHDAALLRCYESARGTDPSLAGSLTVELHIEKDGSVSDLQVRDQGLGAKTATCVRGALSGLSFMASEGSTLVTVQADFRP